MHNNRKVLHVYQEKLEKKREHQQRASNKFHLLLMGVCLYARDYKCDAFREEKKTWTQKNCIINCKILQMADWMQLNLLVFVALMR